MLKMKSRNQLYQNKEKVIFNRLLRNDIAK